MKSIVGFFTEIVDATNDKRRDMCMKELSAMKEEFCKHNKVKLFFDEYGSILSHYNYNFSYTDFKIFNGDLMVNAIRYYPYDDEWILIANKHNDDNIEYCLNSLENNDLIKVILLMKKDIFFETIERRNFNIY